MSDNADRELRDIVVAYVNAVRDRAENLEAAMRRFSLTIPRNRRHTDNIVEWKVEDK